jgi:hypothetical protein
MGLVVKSSSKRVIIFDLRRMLVPRISNPALVERNSRRNLAHYYRYVRAFSGW